MPLPHRLPASVRYIKARFRPLMQFRFWLAIIVVSLTSLFAWEAWQNPEWLINSEEETSTTASDPLGENGISNEDSAIAADIDSLPVLLEQLNSTSTSLKPTTSNQAPQTLFDEFLKKQAAAQAQRNASEKAATATSAYDPLEMQPPGASNLNVFDNSPSLPSGNQALPGYSVPGTSAGSNSVGGTSPLNATPQNSPVPTNPLQEALQRSSPVNSTTPSNQIPTNGVGQNATGVPQPNTAGSLAGAQPAPSFPGQGAAPTSPYSPGLNYSNMPVQGVGSASSFPGNTGSGISPASGNVPLNASIYSQPQAVPGAAPLQPATPSVVPVTPGNLVQNGISGSGIPNSANFINPGLQPSQLQPSQMAPQPFSVPRPVPGRYIGGGRINTFSNP